MKCGTEQGGYILPYPLPHPNPLSLALLPKRMVAAFRFGNWTEVRKSMHTDIPKKSCTSHTQLILPLKMYQTTHSADESSAEETMRVEEQ